MSEVHLRFICRMDLRRINTKVKSPENEQKFRGPRSVFGLSRSKGNCSYIQGMLAWALHREIEIGLKLRLFENKRAKTRSLCTFS